MREADGLPVYFSQVRSRYKEVKGHRGFDWHNSEEAKLKAPKMQIPGGKLVSVGFEGAGAGPFKAGLGAGPGFERKGKGAGVGNVGAGAGVGICGAREGISVPEAGSCTVPPGKMLPWEAAPGARVGPELGALDRPGAGAGVCGEGVFAAPSKPDAGAGMGPETGAGTVAICGAGAGGLLGTGIGAD